MTKKHWIEILRKDGFNCFLIPHNQKKADYRYNASKTTPNQPITEDVLYKQEIKKLNLAANFREEAARPKPRLGGLILV